ncbi:hypothetical protein ACTQ33_01135 [Candidatus Avoscillospira sp. LCP25S3_F1]|uniref:hypothetical protein n=1 Tax=Candidatus Avoscillospira sp. LCP25S3_F1 TaxID=3438825 RepID=UPI003F8FA91A
MKIKVCIGGRVLERTIKKFCFSSGGIVHYITVDRVPYVVEMHNGNPSGLVPFAAFSGYYFGGERT